MTQGFDPLSVLASGTLGAAEMPASLDAATLAGAAGAYRWMELELFELLASVPPGTPGGVGVRASVACGHHGWHAELWAERLASLGAEDSALTKPPTAGFAALARWLREGSPGVLERLVAAYRVLLPRLFVSYQAHAEAAAGVADGPVARTLRLILAEESRWAWQGEADVLGLLVDADAVAVAARAQQEMETMLCG